MARRRREAYEKHYNQLVLIRRDFCSDIIFHNMRRETYSAEDSVSEV